MICVNNLLLFRAQKIRIKIGFPFLMKKGLINYYLSLSEELFETPLCDGHAFVMANTPTSL